LANDWLGTLIQARSYTDLRAYMDPIVEFLR